MKQKRMGIWLVGLLTLVVLLVGETTVLAAGSAEKEIDAQTQYAAAKSAILYIRGYYSSGSLKATGSGFVIAEDGLALTAAHVIEKSARVTAVDAAGKELNCSVVSCDADTDVAVLRLPKGRYKALSLSGSAPAGGAAVRAMGYPAKDTLIITEGLVSSPEGNVNDKQRTLVSCQVVGGMSGGPVLDRYGKVAGLCSGSVRTMNGIHLSARWEDLCTAVNTANRKEAAK